MLALSPSQMEWALLLMALMVAFVLRVYQLGAAPPGLYRDEAINGLDALSVLQGRPALFFAANNGREPLYIYLSAAAIALFGQTIFAVRIAAALVGALTTLPVFLLGKSWFNASVGLLAAWLWAITLWPVHLSRIGLRVILLAPLLALTFWVGTRAYRGRSNRLWFLSGLLYGLAFYTYLAVRFSPIFLALLLAYLLFTGRKSLLWPGVAWFALGAFVALLPLLILVAQQPQLVFGRSSQVSILHPDVNDGDFWGTLIAHTTSSLAMFGWRGDAILRHNPSGRPVFDRLMLIPFVLGVLWCLRQWRRPPAAAVLLWSVVMLGPTILAADAPHFLRAAGVLPAIVYFPALGLEAIWRWQKLPMLWRRLAVAGLVGGSLLITIRDYTSYARDPQVANAFEAVAAGLAQEIADTDAGSAVYLDERLYDDWPSIPYLTGGRQNLQIFGSPAELAVPLEMPADLYAWPYESLDYVPQVSGSPALISAVGSDMVYDELDGSAYQLFNHYRMEKLPDELALPAVASGDGLLLQDARLLESADDRLVVEVYWRADMALAEELAGFVHVVDEGRLIAQKDGPPADGYWHKDWWRPGLVLVERRLIPLPEPYDPQRQRILLGLYRASTSERIMLVDPQTGEPMGTEWAIEAE